MRLLSTFAAAAWLICLPPALLWMNQLGKELAMQTALLKRIAEASEQTATNTNNPMRVKWDAMSEGTQHALEDALKPERKK